MYDTRAWRGPAVVGGDGIDRRHPLSQRNMTQAVEDFWFCEDAMRRTEARRNVPVLSFVQTLQSKEIIK
jgi:hypothetical protein